MKCKALNVCAGENYYTGICNINIIIHTAYGENIRKCEIVILIVFLTSPLFADLSP